MNEYYVRIKGRGIGPYSLDRLRRMVSNGEVGRMHEVSTDGLAWAPTASFPEIFEREPARPAAAVSGDAASPTVVTQDETGPAPAARDPLWYRARDGKADGPMSQERLVSLIHCGEVATATFVFKEGTTAWVRAVDVPELAASFAAPTGPHGSGDPDGVPGETTSYFDYVVRPRRRLRRYTRRSKDVATVLAMLFGGLGIHHFYLGNPAFGIVYLLSCWTLIPVVVGFVEGLVYLSMSGAAFDRKFNR